MLVETLTGGERRQLKLLPANRPFPYLFEDLTPERHYLIRFEGVENADTRFGGFTTPPRHQPEVGLGNDLDMGGDDGDGGGVTMVVVSGDSPLKGIADVGGSDDEEEEEVADEGKEGMDAEELLAAEGQKGKGVSSLWQTISAVAERPFGGLDATLHIGGQVDMDGVTNDAAALIGRAAREPPGSKVSRVWNIHGSNLIFYRR